MLKDLAITFVSMTCDILNLVIFFDVLLSWIVPVDNKIFQFIDSLARPILNGVKKIIPPLGMIDISPMIALIGLEILKNILVTILSSL